MNKISFYKSYAFQLSEYLKLKTVFVQKIYLRGRKCVRRKIVHFVMTSSDNHSNDCLLNLSYDLQT